MPAASGATTLVPGDPARVAAVERIFERYATLGMGLGAVAASLNREGLPSPFAGMAGKRGGGTWGTGTIREILRNPAYAGSMAWNRKSYAKFHSVKDGRAVERSKVDGGRSCQNAESDWEIVPDAHEALVPKALFDEANRLLKQRAGTTTDRGTRATKRNSVYLLSGLVRCGRCGSRFQGYKTIKGRRTPGARRIETLYYACGGYVCHGNA
ncbi:MAG TPA: recombinase family protein, partial [Planctomycetota bacterium]|nr:recombinase family protein [Planctomycetota bacterium]